MEYRPAISLRDHPWIKLMVPLLPEGLPEGHSTLCCPATPDKTCEAGLRLPRPGENVRHAVVAFVACILEHGAIASGPW